MRCIVLNQEKPPTFFFNIKCTKVQIIPLLALSPALRKAVMASITAARRSNAPACAPCHIMANSPDTLYTAKGWEGNWRGTREGNLSDILQTVLLGFSHLCFIATEHVSGLVTDLVFDLSHDVQIWQTWFHHQHISSFSHISLLQRRTTARSPTTASTQHS